jgi:hypothetical protein
MKAKASLLILIALIISSSLLMSGCFPFSYDRSDRDDDQIEDRNDDEKDEDDENEDEDRDVEDDEDDDRDDNEDEDKDKDENSDRDDENDEDEDIEDEDSDDKDKGDEDIFSIPDGYSLDVTEWVTTGDGSYLVFEDDSHFKYYQSQDEDANYYEGTYEVYFKEDAFDYITEDLKDYYFEEDELNDLMDRADGYDIKNLICFVLHNEACYVDGENTLDKPTDTPYMGFVIENEDGDIVLDVSNMNSGTYVTLVSQ